MRPAVTKIVLTFCIVVLAYTFYRRHLANQTSDHEQADQITAPVEVLSGEFKTFYNRFHSDSAYQVAHIIWPLKRITDDTISLPDWTPDTWILHRPFDDMDGTFAREFAATGNLVVEHISDQSGTYSMERHFAPTSQGYALLYYRPMGLYGQE